jgi:hypothetical protein
MSMFEQDLELLERRRNAGILIAGVRRELEAEHHAREAAARASLAASGYHPCPYCGAELNVRCCEFGRDR